VNENRSRCEPIVSPDLAQTICFAEANAIPASPRERWMSAGMIALLFVTSLAAACDRQRSFPVAPAFVPAFAGVVGTADVLAAALLLNLYWNEGNRLNLATGSAYVVNALLIVPWAIMFPGVVGAGGFIGGEQSSPWLLLTWHVTFPVAVTIGAVCANAVAGPRRRLGEAALALAAGAAVAALTVGAVSVGHDRLPAIVRGPSFLPLWGDLTVAAALVNLAAGGFVLRTSRPLGAVNFWIVVVLVASALDMGLNALAPARFSTPWYVGKLQTMVSASFVLLALLATWASWRARSMVLAGELSLFNLVFEAAPSALLLIDARGRITLANAQSEKLFGYPRSELLGTSIGLLVPERFRSGPAARGRHKDAGDIPIEVALNSIQIGGRTLTLAAIADGRERTAAEQERQRSESRMREQNRMLAIAERMTHIGHWRLDLLSNELYWSDETHKIFDVPAAEQPTLAEALAKYHPDDREFVSSGVKRAIATGSAFTHESRIVRPDGTIRHVVSSGQPERTSDGTLVALFGVLHDVTEITASERERTLLLERVTVATRALQIGIWDWDVATADVNWDPLMFKLFGVADTGFVPTLENALAAIHADDRSRVEAAFARTIDSGAQFDTEFRVVWPSGEERTLRAVANVVFDGGGAPTRVVGADWDVTEARVLAEDLRTTAVRDRATAATLSRANMLMKMAEEMAHYGHWRIDLGSNEIYWSDEVYRIVGLPAGYKPTLEEALALYDPNGVDVAAIVRQAAIDGKPFVYEARLLRPDKRFRDVRCTGQAELSAKGDVVALAGIFHDITERKDAERGRDLLTARVARATQTGSVGLWEWAPDTGSMTWLTHMFQLYGLDAAVVPSYELWKSTLHASDRERAVRAFEDALAGLRPFDTEFRVVWPSGEVRSIRAQAICIRNAADEVVRVIGINWDNTNMRSLADEMHAEQERLETIERERLYEHERRWSRTFQRAVLPASLPHIRGCTFDAVYEPGLRDAQVGGDWYDAIRLPDGRILVSIGDVSGSGLQAAVVVGVARQIIRGISQLHADPMLILDAADRALCLEYPGVYVSAWVGLIDLLTKTITYASAGHPPPLLVAKDGTVRELTDPTTMLIGLRQGRRGQANTVTIAHDDAIVLYTDGITEAARDVIAGTTLLTEAAAKLATVKTDHPAAFIKRQVIPDGSSDDVALLVVRIDYQEAEQHVSRWQFDVADGRAASVVRGEFVASLRRLGFAAEARANAELVFGELIGNVVRHARHTTEVDVAISHGGPRTVLHVLDGGGGFNHISRLPRDPYAENGRGLFLIAALTEEFTVSERPDGGSHARAVLMRERT
jgi:PAS domain S-box-containing protein